MSATQNIEKKVNNIITEGEKLKQIKELNNPESKIYKNTRENLELYILTKLDKSRSQYFKDKLKLLGEKEEIKKHLNLGLAQNIVQAFFKKENNCVVCFGKKNENGIKQLERAHSTRTTRTDLIIKAIDELWIDNKTPIESGVLLKKFIDLHSTAPVYTLCNLCHKMYDK